MLRKSKSSYLFLLPAIIIMLIFFVGPILVTIVYSFTNLILTGSAANDLQFIGLENYRRMFSTGDVPASLGRTLIFLFGSLIGQSVLGFILAYNMRGRNPYFRRVVGPVVLVGWVMPEIVVAICMSAFFGDKGTANSILQFIGLNKVSWMYEHAMLTVVLSNIWRGTAFSMLMFQAGLDSVPKEIEEAAIVDGTNKFQLLTRIILPYMSNTIMTNTILNTLQTLGVFGLIYTMTGGGPGSDTQVLAILMYENAFKNFQFGYGTAISMVLLAIGIMLSVVYTRLMRREM